MPHFYVHETCTETSREQWKMVVQSRSWQLLRIFLMITHKHSFFKNISMSPPHLYKKNTSMGKGTVHRLAKRAKRISRQNIKTINKNYFTMLSLWTSLCITSWYIYITTAATQKKSVKGYSFWNVDSVTFLATTVARLCRMLACGTFTCFSTWYLSASLSLLMCALGNVFFFAFH